MSTGWKSIGREGGHPTVIAGQLARTSFNSGLETRKPPGIYSGIEWSRRFATKHRMGY